LLVVNGAGDPLRDRLDIGKRSSVTVIFLAGRANGNEKSTGCGRTAIGQVAG